jgi:hypothetical protein
LRRDGADAGARPRDETADIREFRLHGNTEVAGDGVVGNDAVGVSAFEKIGWWRLWRLVEVLQQN